MVYGPEWLGALESISATQPDISAHRVILHEQPHQCRNAGGLYFDRHADDKKRCSSRKPEREAITITGTPSATALTPTVYGCKNIGELNDAKSVNKLPKKNRGLAATVKCGGNEMGYTQAWVTSSTVLGWTFARIENPIRIRRDASPEPGQLPGRELSPKTGYAPAEDSRQVPSPTLNLSHHPQGGGISISPLTNRPIGLGKGGCEPHETPQSDGSETRKSLICGSNPVITKDEAADARNIPATGLGGRSGRETQRSCGSPWCVETPARDTERKNARTRGQVTAQKPPI